MSELNEREKAFLEEVNVRAKGDKNVDVLCVWRDGKLADVKMTLIVDRKKVKDTH